MKILKIIFVSAGTLAVLFALLMLSGYSEGYCYFWPTIDTKYAEGYSEKQFAQLTVGMTRAEAENIMCVPLGVSTNKSGLVQIFYTSDGAAPFGDFAWFGRGLEASNGVVTRVVNRIYYD
jgi:hypothetical protein